MSETRKPSRFLRNSMIYAVGDLLTKGARIILIPYFIACLTKEEVGGLAILQAIIFATWTLLSFGLGVAVQRFYVDYGEDRDPFVSTLWLVRFLLGLPFLALLWASAAWVPGNGLFGISSWLIGLAFTAGFFKASLNIVEQAFIIREEPLAYRSFTFFQFLSTTLLTILLITGFKMGLAGAIVAELVSYAVWNLIAVVILFRRAWPKISCMRWSECFLYSLPMIPHAMFMWVLSGADRLLLDGYVTKDQIAEYHIGYLLASLISVAAMSMRSAWLPNYFANPDRMDASARFGKMTSLYFLLTCAAAVATVSFAPEIVSVFSSFGKSDYSEAASVIRWVAPGMVGFALFVGVNQPLFYERRIGLIALISFAGLATNIVLNLFLIPKYGIWGAAMATIGGYGLISLAMMLAVKTLYQIPFELSRLFYFLGLAVTISLLGIWVFEEISYTVEIGKGVLCLAFVGLALITIERHSDSRWRMGWSRDLLTALGQRKVTAQ